MKTIFLNQPGDLSLADTEPPPALEPGQSLVRVRRVGICGTDIHAFRGRQPFFTFPRILGHELGVEVVDPGNRSDLRAGSRCAVEPYLNCGRCIACRRGKTNCCADLKVLGVHIDGGMRELIVVPGDKLHSSEHLSLEQLALVETLGIGAHAVQRAALEPEEYVLVLGAGPIGLTVMQFAKAEGARVIVADVNPNRLEFCRQHLKVDFTLDAGADMEKALSSITGGDLPTAVFDATGNPQSMMGAFRLVAPGGKLVFVGLFQGDVTFSDPELHRKEVTLLATRNSTAAEFRRIIRLIEKETIDTHPWITHRAACEEFPKLFPQWLEPDQKLIKGVVSFE